MLFVETDFDVKNLFAFDGRKGFVWRETRPFIFQGFANELPSARHGTATVSVIVKGSNIEISTPKGTADQEARERYVLEVANSLGQARNEQGEIVELKLKKRRFWRGR